MSMENNFKYCFVPLCTSTSVRTPEKIFFIVPYGSKRRKLWVNACKRDGKTTSSKSLFYCCSDHFNLENDATNYLQYKLCAIRPILKKECIPSIFPWTKEKQTRLQSENRTRKEFIANLIAENESLTTVMKHPIAKHGIRSELKELDENKIEETHTKSKSTSAFSVTCISDADISNKNQGVLISTSPFKVSKISNQNMNRIPKLCSTSPFKVTNVSNYSDVEGETETQDSVTSTSAFNVSEINRDVKNRNNITNNVSSINSQFKCPDLSNGAKNANITEVIPTTSRVHDLNGNEIKNVPNNYVIDNNSKIRNEASGVSKVLNFDIQDISIKKNKKPGPKAKPKHFRSVQVQVDISLSCENKSSQTVYIKNPPEEISSTESENSTELSDQSEWQPDLEHSEDDIIINENERINILCRTRKLHQEFSQLYLGVPGHYFFIVVDLAEKINYTGTVLTKTDITCLVLRKIRLNESFIILSHCFGISERYASRLFANNVDIIANHLSHFIFLLPVESVKANLPLGFWIRSRNVYIIFDALETQVEISSNAINQSITWSSYKSCNTFKFIVGVSPDGTIMIKSKAYVGRISDIELVKRENIINMLPENTETMADRGFKGIEQELAKRNIKLVRPPSVIKNEPHSKTLAKESKQISSLRIHVERSIRRIREFKLLAPHATINHSFYSHIDSIFTIVCALVNIQNPLLKI